MNTGDLRKQILRALDEARKSSTDRRQAMDEARQAWEQFLEMATPLVKQAATILRGEGHLFAANTPADGLRLTSETSPQIYLEFELDVAGAAPHVTGRVSYTKSRQQAVVEEQSLAFGKPVRELNETDVAAYLVTEIPKLIVR
jgi:hypothetical protein